VRRRQFISLAGSAVAVWPLSGHAQRPAQPVVGFLRLTVEGAEDFVAAFRQGVREAGLVEGESVVIEVRSADGRRDRMPALVSDLLRIPASVIVGGGFSPEMQAAAGTVPVVFVYGSDPIRDGIVGSLRRPGGNVTGVTFLTTALAAKQLELLHALVPAVTTIGYLVDADNFAKPSAVADVQAAAPALGARVIVATVGTEAEIDAAFAAFAEQRVGAFMVAGGQFFLSRRRQIVALAARHALPAMYENRAFTTAGGLASYSGDIPDAYRQAGIYAGRLVRGASPADLPVVQGTRVALVLNLRTARTLGITFPPDLLARADEVIE